jgi:outer membrane protein assembly factor BamB
LLEEIWEFVTEELILSSPAVVDDLVFFGSFDKYLFVLKKYKVV